MDWWMCYVWEGTFIVFSNFVFNLAFNFMSERLASLICFSWGFCRDGDFLTFIFIAGCEVYLELFILTNNYLQTRGTPQGCCLSPLLFILYTNECHSNFTNKYILKFADYTQIVSLCRRFCSWVWWVLPFIKCVKIKRHDYWFQEVFV